MRAIYEKGTANFPRLATDVLFSDYENDYHYDGFVDDAIRYIEEFQLLDPVHWRRFVFREGAQLRWLAAHLEQSHAKWHIILCHAPLEGAGVLCTGKKKQKTVFCGLSL